MAAASTDPGGPPPFDLVESREDDAYFDYCLLPYAPRRMTSGKLRSENLLWRSLEVGGALEALRPPLLALQRALGQGKTVWGAKWDGARLFWEIYVYDPRKAEPRATLRAVTETLAPWLAIEPRLPETLPYTMFSFDLDEAAVARRAVAEVSLYLTAERGDAGRSYRARGAALELENVYRFLDPKHDVAELLALVKDSVFVDYSAPARLAGVLSPELLACTRVCVAKKRASDGVYFSGLAVTQLAYLLRRFAYPPALVDLVTREKDRLDHLAFDVGVDYRGGEGGALVYPKTSFYGTL